MARIKQRTLHISLDFLGHEWEDAYIDVRRLRWADLKRYDAIDATKTTNADAEQMIAEALSDIFLSGKAPDEAGQLIDLTKDDLKDFDIDAQSQIYRLAMGEPGPNA